MQRVPVIYLLSSMEVLLSSNGCSPLHQVFAPLGEVEALLFVSQSDLGYTVKICHGGEGGPYASRLKTKCGAAGIDVEMDRYISSSLTLLAGSLLPKRQVSVMELRLPPGRPAEEYIRLGEHIAQGVEDGVAVVCLDRQGSRENLTGHWDVQSALQRLKGLQMPSGKCTSLPGDLVRDLIYIAVGISGRLAPSHIFGSAPADSQRAFNGCGWF